MSQWDKLISRIRNLSKDIRFEEIAKVLNELGYIDKQPGNGSSHHTFRKPGHRAITIKKSNYIKKAYVKMVRDAIEEDDENDKRS